MVGEPSDLAKDAAESKTVLLVEDEILVRLAMAADLADAGFNVIQAAHADEALRVLQRMVVDLVATDITMPAGSIDGLALVDRVRENWPEIKVMILSSHVRPELRFDAADVCLTKPEGLGLIVDCVRKLLAEDGS